VRKGMESFRRLKSMAVPLDLVNIDTDQIIPKQFLKLVHKAGYGKYLFYDWRFDSEGKPREDFVLNNAIFNNRQILLTRDNFGSGSSREHAVWAIRDYGFKAIIAPSFADIFFNNCFKNGILPIRLSQQEVEYLFQIIDNAELDINLPSQEIIVTGPGDSKVLKFEVEESKKMLLIEGLDEIGITLHYDSYISEYEERNNTKLPSGDKV
jgi:3-isopropylmalate/(R)-2-methylmalate dehydratase small subunit